MDISLDELTTIREKAYKTGYDAGYQEGHGDGYIHGTDYSDSCLEARIEDLEEELDEIKVEKVHKMKTSIYIEDVFRLVAGHSIYSGDSILTAFTCLSEGKDVKDITPLDISFAEIADLRQGGERPHGEWIEGYHNYFETLDCSQCGYVRDNRYENFNFCPNCGADMRKESEND